jgi:hypothetical protein
MDQHYYELHVTVLPERVLEFASFCEKIKAKPLYIQLQHGLHKDQLMLATTNMLNNDTDALAWMNDYADMLRPHFTLTRVKLESRLTEGERCYYEAHWKLDFKYDPHFWTCETQKFLVKHPELLWSRNLFDTRIHYLSQRIYDHADPILASHQFNASGVAINFDGLPLVKTHYERCVFDDNPSIDAGWASNVA